MEKEKRERGRLWEAAEREEKRTSERKRRETRALSFLSLFASLLFPLFLLSSETAVGTGVLHSVDSSTLCEDSGRDLNERERTLFEEEVKSPT